MSIDLIVNSIHSVNSLTVPSASLSDLGNKPLPEEGSLLYNLDNNLLYVSTGAGGSWSAVGNGAVSGPVHVTDTTPSTTCSTGSITTAGGVGVLGSVNICGTLAIAGGSTFSGEVNILSTEASTSPTTGALVVTGGVGIGGNLYVGGNLIVTGSNRATQLATTGADVVISGASPPSSGQILTATSATTANWQNVNASSITGVLPVINGGTGDSTLTSGNVLVGNGTSPVTTTKAAPVGAFVGTSDSQILTNKNITDVGSVVTASNLFSASTTIGISSATVPTSGQVLTATSGTAATWQTPSGGGPATQLATSGSPVTVDTNAPGSSGYYLITNSATNAIWQIPALYSVLFAITSTSSQVASPGSNVTLTWTGGSVLSNTGGGSFTGNTTYNVPATGLYMVIVSGVNFSASSTSSSGFPTQMWINANSADWGVVGQYQTTGVSFQMSTTAIISLSASATITVVAAQSTSSGNINIGASNSIVPSSFTVIRIA